MCAATGAQARALSTLHFDCSADTRLVAAGGTLANLIFGVLFWVAARAVKQISSLRYFFWLLMTFNLLDAGGYFLFSGIGNIGDWAAVVAGWQPAWAWRVGLTVVGAFTYFLLFVPLCLRELRPFLGRDAKIRVRRAPTHARALSHFRNPLLCCGRAKPGGTPVDSDLRRRVVVWWPLRSGMDVEPALWPALRQQRIADARDRTKPGMDGRRGDSADSVHRRTRTRR